MHHHHTRVAHGREQIPRQRVPVNAADLLRLLERQDRRVCLHRARHDRRVIKHPHTVRDLPCGKVLPRHVEIETRYDRVVVQSRGCVHGSHFLQSIAASAVTQHVSKPVQNVQVLLAPHRHACQGHSTSGTSHSTAHTAATATGSLHDLWWRLKRLWCRGSARVRSKARQCRAERIPHRQTGFADSLLGAPAPAQQRAPLSLQVSEQLLGQQPRQKRLGLGLQRLHRGHRRGCSPSSSSSLCRRPPCHARAGHARGRHVHCWHAHHVPRACTDAAADAQRNHRGGCGRERVREMDARRACRQLQRSWCARLQLALPLRWMAHARIHAASHSHRTHVHTHRVACLLAFDVRTRRPVCATAG
mmetsp:Transcript_13514/g.43173  ORF Transcript_13514/g.43173 Transcript_13514/m.43173 type:complete len:360 (-) Transcript_13514:869-1948(-)